MADKEAPKDKEEKDEVPAGPKKILGLPLPTFAFVAVNVLVMAGGLGFVVWASLLYKKPRITDEQVVKEVQKAAVKEAPATAFLTESYPEMTITLKSLQGGKNRYATVETVIVCGSEECLAQVKGNKAKIEDAIQNGISSRSYSELTSLEVKFRVKHEILSKVNSFLKDTAATDILFTNFVVQ
jgi:flagellar FliL protein